MKNRFLNNIIVFFVFLFLFLPIIILVIYSFNSSKMNILFENFTLDWYKNLGQNKDLLEAFRNTLIVAFTSTILSTIIGTISAYGLFKYDFKGKDFINKLLYIPIVIPEIVLGISLLSVYTLAKINLGLFTIILSHIVFSIPFIIVSVRTSLTSNVKSLEEAARDLNASNYEIFTKIILPEILPGIISGFTLAFSLSLDDVVISYFTAGPGSNTLPLYIYSMIKTGITPDVNALTSIMLFFTIGLLLTFTVIQGRKIGRDAK